MNNEQIIENILSSIPDNNNTKLLNLCTSLLVNSSGLENRWVAVSFAKSKKKPIAHIITHKFSSYRDEQLLQRGPIYLHNQPPNIVTYLDEIAIRKIAGKRLSALFPRGAIYIPIPPSTVVTLSNDYAGAILYSIKESSNGKGELSNIDRRICGLIQIGASLALARLEIAEADRRMFKKQLPTLDQEIAKAKTRREVCAAILEHLCRYIPYEKGIIYLLDPEPGRNRYLIYGATRNEDPKNLYCSIMAESVKKELGFTWHNAMGRIPQAGSSSDVPPEIAKGHNDEASKLHYGTKHEAWALIPFTFNGMTRAVAHIEGVHFGEGASIADLEVMRRISESFGSLLERSLSGDLSNNYHRASMHQVEELYKVQRLDGEKKRPGVERFVCKIFSEIGGIQQIKVVKNKNDKCFPQIDGIFTILMKNKNFVLEVKAPDDDKKAMGIDSIRQLKHQMEALGANRGFLVTTGCYSAKTDNSINKDGLILVLDGQRLERFCALSPVDRKNEFFRWIKSKLKGVCFVEIG